ncbi:MAG: TerB family tellurite resistance protein [Gammaproteobacteria bacterium]
MLKSLQSLIRDWKKNDALAPPPVEIAGLALLLEISRADHNHTPSEETAILAAATRVFTLDPALIGDLLVRADAAVEQAVSLYDFTQVLNECLDRATKRRLLEQLWRVAFADGELDRYEEYYLRKIADLLHLGHGDLIRAKLAVAPT